MKKRKVILEKKGQKKGKLKKNKNKKRKKHYGLLL